MTLNILSIKIDSIPTGPGVYKFSTKNQIIYIGKAKNLQKRVNSYFSNKNNYKVKNIIKISDKLDWILTKNENEALYLEAKLIYKYKPKFNVKLKENKHIPRIAIDYKSITPRIFPYYGINNENLLIFGPYPSLSTKFAIDILTNVYPLRVCNDKVYSRANKLNRACMLYDIGKCSAPCISKINNLEYHKLVKNTKKFLNNKRNNEINNLEIKMNNASKIEDYSLAKYYRDKLNFLKIFMNNDYLNIEIPIDTDAFSIVSLYGKSVLGYAQFRDNNLYASGHLVFDNGKNNKNKIFKEAIKQFYLLYNSASFPKEIILDKSISDKHLFLGNKATVNNNPKKEQLFLLGIASRHTKEAIRSDNNLYKSNTNNYDANIKELNKIINNSIKINRIEVYDNSHKKGRGAIAGVIVFENGELVKEESRRIKLSVNNGDDYASMREIAIKRFTKSRLGYSDNPDMILIDGGKEQLKSFIKATQDINLKYEPIYLSIAKENEELYFDYNDKPFKLIPGTNLFNFITMLRDKAHSNALYGHRKLVTKENNFEIFDFLSNKQKESLFSKFGDLNAIYQASYQDLQGIKYIGTKTIDKLYNYISNT